MSSIKIKSCSIKFVVIYPVKSSVGAIKCFSPYFEYVFKRNFELDYIENNLFSTSSELKGINLKKEKSVIP